jgi:diaminopimelate epimerase
MRRSIPFTKASGAGNDFIILDNLHGGIPEAKDRIARALCSRHFGIGADGLLVIEPSATAEFRMLYYNADGSYGGMCGNGGRCLARYAFLRGIARESMSFEALDTLYRAEIQGPAVRLHMKDPSKVALGLLVEVARQKFRGSFIDTGSPHLVIFDEALEERDVTASGRAIAHHSMFGTEGTNVNFLQLLGGDRIAMRTYERGVEVETLACGTGSVASAVIANLKFGLQSPVHVRTRGGEDLHVEFRNDQGTIHDVVLIGSAQMLFDGQVCYDDSTGRIVERSDETASPPLSKIP